MASGRFAREITPVAIPQRKGDPKLVETDEHPRPETTFEALGKLKAPFRAGGSVTAGNASGVNDGSAALILASELAAKRHGLTPIARVLGAAMAGVPPRIMGIGPAPASKKLMGRLGLRQADFDVIELNEAFASQVLAATTRDLGLADNDSRDESNGGAIALGHPLGSSGARITGTAAIELQLRHARRSLSAMCIGVGQGIAIALERIVGRTRTQRRFHAPPRASLPAWFFLPTYLHLASPARPRSNATPLAAGDAHSRARHYENPQVHRLQ